MKHASAQERYDALPASVQELYPWPGELLEQPSGHQQHIIDVGPRDGEILVFVHGNPTWSFYWRTLIQPLSDAGYRCIAVDHLGCGLSDKPQDWTYVLKDHQANLARVLAELDVQDATLVCHDWGGPIGYGGVLADADRFKRFVVFNTLSRFGDFPLSIKMCRWPIVGPLAVRGGNAFLKFALRRGTAKPEQYDGPIGEGYLAPYGSWHDRIAIQRFVDDIPVERQHPTAWARDELAQGIRTQADKPHLIIWGTQDFVFHRYFLEGWKQDLPDAKVIEVDSANHFVVEDAHEQIVPWVTDWLAEHPLQAEPSGPPAADAPEDFPADA